MQLPAESLYLSAVTIGELYKGVAELPEGNKKSKLERWIVDDILHGFAGRILPYDTKAAALWGEWLGTEKRKGFVLPVLDTQIAAIAVAHDCVLVTRNGKDMQRLPVVLLNPWDHVV